MHMKNILTFILVILWQSNCLYGLAPESPFINIPYRNICDGGNTALSSIAERQLALFKKVINVRADLSMSEEESDRAVGLIKKAELEDIESVFGSYESVSALVDVSAEKLKKWRDSIRDRVFRAEERDKIKIVFLIPSYGKELFWVQGKKAGVYSRTAAFFKKNEDGGGCIYLSLPVLAKRGIGPAYSIVRHAYQHITQGKHTEIGMDWVDLISKEGPPLWQFNQARNRKRKGREVVGDEQKSCMVQQIPDSSDECVLAPDLDFGKRLRTIRQSRQLSARSLAEKLGVTKDVVIIWERGVNLPSVAQLKKLGEVLEYSISVLFTGYELKYALRHIEEVSEIMGWEVPKTEWQIVGARLKYTRMCAGLMQKDFNNDVSVKIREKGESPVDFSLAAEINEMFGKLKEFHDETAAVYILTGTSFENAFCDEEILRKFIAKESLTYKEVVGARLKLLRVCAGFAQADIGNIGQIEDGGCLFEPATAMVFLDKFAILKEFSYQTPVSFLLTGLPLKKALRDDAALAGFMECDALSENGIIGARLRLLRICAGLFQHDIKCAGDTISRLEKGTWLEKPLLTPHIADRINQALSGTIEEVSDSPPSAYIQTGMSLFEALKDEKVLKSISGSEESTSKTAVGARLKVIRISYGLTTQETLIPHCNEIENAHGISVKRKTALAINRKFGGYKEFKGVTPASLVMSGLPMDEALRRRDVLTEYTGIAIADERSLFAARVNYALMCTGEEKKSLPKAFWMLEKGEGDITPFLIRAINSAFKEVPEFHGNTPASYFFTGLPIIEALKDTTLMADFADDRKQLSKEELRGARLQYVRMCAGYFGTEMQIAHYDKLEKGGTITAVSAAVLNKKFENIPDFKDVTPCSLIFTGHGLLEVIGSQKLLTEFAGLDEVSDEINEGRLIGVRLEFIIECCGLTYSDIGVTSKMLSAKVQGEKGVTPEFASKMNKALCHIPEFRNATAVSYILTGKSLLEALQDARALSLFSGKNANSFRKRTGARLELLRTCAGLEWREMEISNDARIENGRVGLSIPAARRIYEKLGNLPECKECNSVSLVLTGMPIIQAMRDKEAMAEFFGSKSLNQAQLIGARLTYLRVCAGIFQKHAGRSAIMVREIEEGEALCENGMLRGKYVRHMTRAIETLKECPPIMTKLSPEDILALYDLLGVGLSAEPLAIELSA